MKKKIIFAVLLAISVSNVGCSNLKNIKYTVGEKYETYDGISKSYAELTEKELRDIQYDVFPIKEDEANMQLKLNGQETIESFEFSKYNTSAVEFIKNFIVSNNLNNFGATTYQEYTGDLANGSEIINIKYYDWQKPLDEKFGRIDYQVNKTYSGKYTGDVTIEVSIYVNPEEYYNKPFIFEDSIFYDFSKNLLGSGIDYSDINRDISIAFKNLTDSSVTTGWESSNYYDDYDFVKEKVNLYRDSKTYENKVMLTYTIEFELKN